MQHNSIYQQIAFARSENRKMIGILLDPDKLRLEEVESCLRAIDPELVDLLLVGGSTVENGDTQSLVGRIKELTSLPVVLFPGDFSQITGRADALLFLNLISGRNSEYLINQQVKAVPLLQETELEVIPTAYILVDGGVETSVARVSKTEPISPRDERTILNTALAGAYMGNKLVYLEAGSGAKTPVPGALIAELRSQIDIPIIAGGGIRSHEQMAEAFESGADMVVIGTAFEQNPKILRQILKDEHIH
jgi:putative glycerol-1-phosphate prenyltransferase